MKWSGVYFLAFFAVYTVVVDVVARKRAGIPFWASGTILKQGPTTFLLMVPIALAGYLVSWTGWFVTKGGYDRNVRQSTRQRLARSFAWVPHTIQSFLQFEYQVWNYNINEHSPHPYAANPFTWLLMIRPTSMYFTSANFGQHGCTVEFLRIIHHGNRESTHLVRGSGGSGLPACIDWLATANGELDSSSPDSAPDTCRGCSTRTAPFSSSTRSRSSPTFCSRSAFVASQLVGTRSDPGPKRDAGMRWIAVFLVAAVAISIFFWPLWTGMQIDFKYMQLHYWLPTWE